MAEFSIISPAMLNLFEECDMKFYFKYVEQVSDAVLASHFEEGKNIHSLAAYFLRGYDVEKYEKVLSEREKLYWNRLKNIEYFGYEIQAVEKFLSVKIGDFCIGGRLDAVVKNGGDYYILDYKTGGVDKDNTYDYQTIVYLLACDRLYRDRESLSFVYVDLKNGSEQKILFSDELREEYEGKIETTCRKMCSIKLSKTVCTEEFCYYSKLCRVVV